MNDPLFKADVTMAAILLILVGVAAYIASAGDERLGGRLGYFALGVAVAFCFVRFRSRR